MKIVQVLKQMDTKLVRFLTRAKQDVYEPYFLGQRTGPLRRAADAKLAVALANDCDLVRCPSCGAITKEMKAYRLKRFGAAFMCMGGGAGILLVVFLLMLFLNKIYFVMAGMGPCVFS